MTMLNHRRRQSILAFLSAAVAGSILFASVHNKRSYTSLLRNNNLEDEINSHDHNHGRQLSSLSKFTDPKSVTPRSAEPIIIEKPIIIENDAPNTKINVADAEHFQPINHKSRNNCQILYILGVEGATHHGFIPILENLASRQVDPITNLPYHVDSEPRALKAGLFGWFLGRIQKWGFSVTPSIDDPAFVQRVVQESCPDDGQKHILIEWASFPSGQEDDKRTYRIHRQHEWLSMSPEEIANTDEALSHPTSMNAFYQGYSPYVDIKFIVLHRPFLETIASHRDWDGGPEIHSNIIRGFMLMLRRFLDMHVFDLVTGRRLWSLVCVERIMAKNYDTKEDVVAARGRVLDGLANFLGWPSGECPHCFDDWRESTKDPVDVLGSENVGVLEEHMKWLEGVWPPPGEEGVAEQQCGI
eukprot:CAMPEP_0172311372 /NCGR_PEP_ID=MMETSP1058-20130122/14634_1 /TAXON_ID=83371 /ORGANISM="Detonula confervacea, Strain CCMP 353" /LENGTH=413 /DNA_ID=CAMNT_0013024531 /DNA_START=14 /DNA_END=1255 /DNA_ORIENTATION=+